MALASGVAQTRQGKLVGDSCRLQRVCSHPVVRRQTCSCQQPALNRGTSSFTKTGMAHAQDRGGSSSVEDSTEPLLPSSVSSDEAEEGGSEQASLWTQLTLYKVTAEQLRPSFSWEAGSHVARLLQYLGCRAGR